MLQVFVEFTVNFTRLLCFSSCFLFRCIKTISETNMIMFDNAGFIGWQVVFYFVFPRGNFEWHRGGKGVKVTMNSKLTLFFYFI